MSEQIIDTLTRRAADAVSRRASILSLGGVSLAALTAVPVAAKGGKGGKGKGKRKKKGKNRNGGAGNIVNPGPTGAELAQVRCAAQGDQCRASLAAICSGEPQCLEGLACCDLFATCDAAGGLNCIIG